MEEIINPNVSNSNSNLVNAKEELQVGMSNLSEQLTEYMAHQDYENLYLKKKNKEVIMVNKLLQSRFTVNKKTIGYLRNSVAKKERKIKAQHKTIKFLRDQLVTRNFADEFRRVVNTQSTEQATYPSVFNSQSQFGTQNTAGPAGHDKPI